MRGSYDIQVSVARVQYKMTLCRNITVIRGKSATGKTALIRMIDEFDTNGPASGVSLSSPKPCHVLSGRNWLRDLRDMTDSFVFIDEGNEFVRSHDFRRAIEGTDNYYVIATRDPMHALPYSVDEIYEIVNTTSRYPGVRKFYSQTRRMYADLPAITHPSVVIVEDEKAGYEFIGALCKKSGVECVSACGKTNVVNVLEGCEVGSALVIADGAAFGPEMEVTLAMVRAKRAGLFLPESFEWLILSSGLVPGDDIARIMADPASYVESRDYLSWERFFTSLLVERTGGTYLEYQKARLNPVYLRDHEFGQIARGFEGTGL